MLIAKTIRKLYDLIFVTIDSHMSINHKSIIDPMQVAQMREKDERVRVITEILGGIKVLKLYAWEGSFTQKIDRLRDKEIRYLKIMQARMQTPMFERKRVKFVMERY